MLRSKKLIFVWNGPKESRWALKGRKWSKTLGFTILVLFGPFWTTFERLQVCHVWPVLVQNGPFLGHPQSWTVDPKVKKRSSPGDHVWPACRTPKAHISYQSYCSAAVPPYFDQLSERYQPLWIWRFCFLSCLEAKKCLRNFTSSWNSSVEHIAN